jgi:salicylate hydroxylase
VVTQNRNGAAVRFSNGFKWGLFGSDGYVLARVLANEPCATGALLEYEALRLPRTRRWQLESRKRGHTSHIVSPVHQLCRNAVYKIGQMIEPHSSGLRTGWIYGYDAVSLA